jgi:hypothetical protein
VPLKPFAPMLRHACGTSDKLLNDKLPHSKTESGDKSAFFWGVLIVPTDLEGSDLCSNNRSAQTNQIWRYRNPFCQLDLWNTLDPAIFNVTFRETSIYDIAQANLLYCGEMPYPVAI